ncbi:DUF309 domain-containing protein [Alicyclobacillus sp. ALC3]|uniref:DUF309 domain-containing protein n=1 Tax=Alicyclobacillus sp. ALC3 TaxID=2796143 RepID=UPI0023796CA1|nr:DUF309 domain-containing protein [Alicyclobacillus sp. ALC3]WDL96233.1 DUF309 domain-containing protein [Alicyclobacillus sp. ALC3]
MQHLPDDRLISYLYCFNVTQDYFTCHEYGESLWLDSGRPQLLKGLIQAAVCLYHLHSGNVRGGYRMWQRAKSYLLPHLPVYAGIDLSQLIRDIDRVYGQVPTQFYDQHVSVAEMNAMNLPDVYISIVDPDLASTVETWQPTSLDEPD